MTIFWIFTVISGLFFLLNLRRINEWTEGKPRKWEWKKILLLSILGGPLGISCFLCFTVLLLGILYLAKLIGWIICGFSRIGDYIFK